MLHSVFDKITFIMISRSGCIVFSVPVLPVGSKLKIGQTFSKKGKICIVCFILRCVFFCLGLLKLIFFDTGSVGFAHFEVDFFVLQQFLRQKGTKPPNFDRTCPAFCQKKPKKPQRIMVNQSRLLFLHKK